MMYYLYDLKDLESALNVFQYVSFRGLCAAVTAFLLCIVFGNKVILKLISLKIGQPIRTKEEVHKLAELHGGKKGTPTMGGVLLLGAVVLSTLIWARPDNKFVWLVVGTTIYLGALGFWDDYTKVTKKNSGGISGRIKLLAQLVLALAVSAFFILNPKLSAVAQELYVPFYKQPLFVMGPIVCVAFFTLIVVGTSNAVNLTDGLDGLATGCTITVSFAYAALTYVAGSESLSTYLQVPHFAGVDEVAVFCMAMVGGGLGFLWFNAYPAKVFMGDTGSLAIGGVLGVVAICCKQELLLAVVGGVFVVEAMSVILQVLSFKLTGKRIFLMSPIHHHFELKGWKENTVIVRFWILSIIFAVMGLATLKLR